MKLFPTLWQVCPANTVCAEIVDCLNKTAPVVEHDTGYRMIRTTNVRHGQVDVEANRFVEEAVFNKWTRRARPKRGDIILSREAPLGEVGMLRSDAKVFLGQRTMLYRADPVKLDQQFLYYQMIGPYVQAQIHGQGSGSTVAHLRVPDAETLHIPIAPLESQRKIAAILSAYDELIEKNQRRIALLEKMAEEIYREWFVRLRFPNYAKVKLMKGIPEGWRTSCLGNVAKFTMGQSPSSEFYNNVGTGLPFHQGVGTYGERFPQTITYCSEDGRRAQKGDILFSVRAPVGRLNIADREMIIGRGLSAIRHKKEHNHYLYYMLKTAFVNEDIIGNGSIFNSVGKDELAKFPIFEPEASLVERFDAIASKIDEQITAFIHATECLKSSRDALLPRLISGKLSVENLDIQFPPGMAEEQFQVA